MFFRPVPWILQYGFQFKMVRKLLSFSKQKSNRPLGSRCHLGRTLPTGEALSIVSQFLSSCPKTYISLRIHTLPDRVGFDGPNPIPTIGGLIPFLGHTWMLRVCIQHLPVRVLEMNPIRDGVFRHPDFHPFSTPKGRSR